MSAAGPFSGFSFFRQGFTAEGDRLPDAAVRQFLACIALSSDALHRAMRTTPDIDDDVPAVAKELASFRRTTAGKVISELARKALAQRAAGQASWENGVLIAAVRGARPEHLVVV